MPATHPGLFKDLNKRVSDLLSKEFPTDNKFEWKGTTANGVTLEANQVWKADGSIISTLTPKYKWAKYGTEFVGEVNTKRELKAEVTTDDQITDGLRTVVTATSKASESAVTVGTEFKHEYATVTASADYGRASGSTLKATAVVGQKGFVLGGSVEYLLAASGPNDLKEVQAVFGYRRPDYDVSLFARLKSEADTDKNEVGFNFFHAVRKDLNVGTDLVVDTTSSDVKPKLSFATQYIFNADTSLKVKFDTAGQLFYGVTQKFNDNAKFTLGGRIDTNNLSAPKSASAVSFTLNLSA